MDGDQWTAYNTLDGSLITPFFEIAYCLSPSAFLPASSCVGNTGLCDPNGNFQGAYNGTFDYSAPIYVNAPAQGNQCIILSGSDVTLQAGNYVMLNPGFIAEYTSNFIATIEPCNGTFKNFDANADEQLLKSKFNVDGTFTNLSIHPNPFTEQCNIQLNHFGSNNPISIFVSDMMGNKVATIANNEQINEGTHQFTFDGSKLSEGMYYCVLIADEIVETQKMMITK